MLNRITNITLHTTAIGEQMAITYSTVDDDGNIIAQNKRAETVILSDDGINAVQTLKRIAQNKIDNK